MWSTLLFDPDFAATLKARVQTWQPTMDMRLAPCTCHPYTRTTTLRYRHPTLHQSTFVIPPRSLACIGQDQLDAPNNEPFSKLKQARKPPMLKYERALGPDDNSITHDERYHSTLYKERFHLIYYHYYYYYHHHHPITIKTILIAIPQKFNGPPKGKSQQGSEQGSKVEQRIRFGNYHLDVVKHPENVYAVHLCIDNKNI